MQLALALFKEGERRRYTPHHTDWNAVDAQLQRFLREPHPVSVREVSRRLGIEVRQLYLHDNQTTRQLGQRWLDYRRRRKAARLEEAMAQLEAAGKEVLEDGKALNLREMTQRLPQSLVHSVQGLYDVLKDVRARVASDTPWSERR